MRTIFGTPVSRYAVPAVLLVLVIIYLGMALTFPADAGLMPLIVGTVLLIMLPVDLISLSDTRLGNWLRERANPVAGEAPEDLGRRRTQVIAMLWVIGFGAAMFILGIPAAVPLYILASLRYLGGKSWKVAVIAAIVVGLSNYLLFQWGLGVELYPGVFLAEY